MIRVLALILLVSVYSSVQAGGFYKWKDEKGVTHITDHPPSVEADVEVEVDTDTRVNRAPMGNSGPEFSQSVVNYQQTFEGQAKEMSEVDKVRAKQLDAEISSARARYAEMNSDKYSARNLSMISSSERREILRKREEAKNLVQKLLSERQILDDKYSSDMLSNRDSLMISSENGNFEKVKKNNQDVFIIENKIPNTPKFGSKGEYYVPAGDGYLNTRTGERLQGIGHGQYTGKDGIKRETGGFLQ